MSTDSGNPARSGSELGSECGLGSKHISSACNHICPKTIVNQLLMQQFLTVQLWFKCWIRERQGHFKTTNHTPCYRHSVCTTHRCSTWENANKCIDLVRDSYLPTSLEVSTRQKRGKEHQEKGSSFYVDAKETFRVDENKTCLFVFVTFIHLLTEGKELYTTGRIEVIFGAPCPIFSVHKSNSPTSAAAYAV